MLKFKTSCAVFAYLSSNLLNEVGLSLFRYFEVGLRVCDIVVKTRSLSHLLMSSCRLIQRFQKMLSRSHIFTRGLPTTMTWHHWHEIKIMMTLIKMIAYYHHHHHHHRQSACWSARGDWVACSRVTSVARFNSQIDIYHPSSSAATPELHQGFCSN